jgi:hypothetical protein
LGPRIVDWADWTMNVHAGDGGGSPEIDKRMQREPRRSRHTTLASLVDEMAERHDLAIALQQMTDGG